MGVITRVAGTGTAGNTGDDGPAVDARLNNPAALAVTGDGGFLIADFGNHVMCMVSVDGVITRLAGTGRPGNRGDGGPAVDAQLSNPTGLAVTGDGGLLISDSGNHVVRRLSAVGTITRIAGNGVAGHIEDDGPATDAQLRAPVGLAVTGDGGYLIADNAGHVVRKVSADGVITTVAGTGHPGNTGDGGLATDAQLKNPNWVAVTADGGFLIADFGNHQVRKVTAG